MAHINKEQLLAIVLLVIGFAVFNERVLHGGYLVAVIGGAVIGVLVRRVWEWAGRNQDHVR